MISKKGYRRWFVLLLPFLLAAGSCATIRVEKPAERYDTTGYQPLYSIVNIPLEISAGHLKKLVNRKLKGQLYADTSFEDNGRDNLMLFASLKDSIDVGFADNFLTYRIPLKIWLRIRTGTELLGLEIYDIRDAEAEVALKFRTKLTINRDWSFTTLTRPDGYEWIKTPRVSVGGFQIPLPVISDILLEGSLDDIARAVDNTMKTTVNLKKIVGDAWIAMQKPILLSPEDSLWLSLTPAEVSSVPIKGTAGMLTCSLGLKTLVELNYREEPPCFPNPELPPLKITSKLSDNFVINLSLSIPFSYINSLARKSLGGYSFQYRSYRVTVKDISIYGQGQYLIVELPVEGSVKGTIYLAGIPVFNRDSLTIELDDLDFSVATKNVAVKTASWLFHSGLVQKLKSRLVFPVGEELRSARESVAETLRENRSIENFRIAGQIDRFDPETIRITRGRVTAYFRFTGRIGITLTVD